MLWLCVTSCGIATIPPAEAARAVCVDACAYQADLPVSVGWSRDRVQPVSDVPCVSSCGGLLFLSAGTLAFLACRAQRESLATRACARERSLLSAARGTDGEEYQILDHPVADTCVVDPTSWVMRWHVACDIACARALALVPTSYQSSNTPTTSYQSSNTPKKTSRQPTNHPTRQASTPASQPATSTLLLLLLLPLLLSLQVRDGDRDGVDAGTHGGHRIHLRHCGPLHLRGPADATRSVRRRLCFVRPSVCQQQYQ